MSYLNAINASIVGINLQLFGKHLFTELMYLLLGFFQLLSEFGVFTLKTINRLLHVCLQSVFVCKDLLITLEMTLALHSSAASLQCDQLLNVENFKCPTIQL